MYKILKCNPEDIEFDTVKNNKNETSRSNTNMSVNAKILREDQKKKIMEDKFVLKAEESKKNLLEKKD